MVNYVPIMRKLVDFFCTELPSLSPEYDIDLAIDLQSSTRPISIPPYRTTPTELVEINIHLQDHLSKRFIRLSVSLWLAPSYL